MINYLKVYEDGTKEATKFKPLFGVKESDLVEKSTEPLGDMQVNNIWLEPSNTPSGELAKETTLDFFGDGSCIATYNLNGNANDLSGNYNGTATNVTYSDGKFGQCCVISAGYITASTGMLTGGDTFTVSLWVKKSSAGVMYLFGLGNNSSMSRLDISVREDGKIAISHYGNDTITTTAPFSFDGNWHNIVVSASSSSTNSEKIYYDNVLQPVAFVTATRNVGATYCAIAGSNGGVYSTSLDGYDQVRIFNRALTEAEVQELYYTYSQNYTPYISQPTYLSQNGKLLEVEVNNGVPSTLQANEDAPKIVEECIQVSKVIQTGNRKIIELGTIFNNNRYVVDNPFGNDKYMDCDVRVEVYANEEWGDPSFVYDVGGRGVKAHSKEDGIVIQTGGAYIVGSNSADTGHSFKEQSPRTSAPARVIVTYVGEAK